MRRLLLILGLTLFAAPAHAATYKDVSYAVHYEGTGKYQKIDREDYPDGDWHEEEINLQFSFTGDIGDGVVFRDGHPFDMSGDDLGNSTVDGSIEFRGANGALTCPVEEESWATGWMRLMEDPAEIVPLDGETHLWLRPFEQFDVSFDCGGSHPGAMLVYPDVGENGETPAGKHTFDTPFSLPREVFGMGYVEQLIPLQVIEGERCPGTLDLSTTKCRLEWEGKIIFRKIWENDVKSDGSPLGPSVGPGDQPPALIPLTPPQPAPKPPAPSALDEDDWLVPLVAQSSAKVDAKGATVTVTCAAGCAGTASVVASGTSARAAAVKPLATARFTAPAGKPTKVRVKLGAKARRKLRRSRRATLRLSFTKPTRRTQTVRLRVR